MEGISNRMISPCAETFEKTKVTRKAQWFTQCSEAVSEHSISESSFYGNNFKQMNDCSSIDVLMITSPETCWFEVPSIRRYYTQ